MSFDAAMAAFRLEVPPDEDPGAEEGFELEEVTALARLATQTIRRLEGERRVGLFKRGRAGSAEASASGAPPTTPGAATARAPVAG